MSEITTDRIRDIEDRITFCEECQNLICRHLGIEIEQKTVLTEKGEMGFEPSKEEKNQQARG